MLRVREGGWDGMKRNSREKQVLVISLVQPYLIRNQYSYSHPELDNILQLMSFGVVARRWGFN